MKFSDRCHEVVEAGGDLAKNIGAIRAVYPGRRGQEDISFALRSSRVMPGRPVAPADSNEVTWPLILPKLIGLAAVTAGFSGSGIVTSKGGLTASPVTLD